MKRCVVLETDSNRFSLLKIAKPTGVQGRRSSGLEGMFFHQVTMVKLLDELRNSYEYTVDEAATQQPATRRGGGGARGEGRRYAGKSTVGVKSKIMTIDQIRKWKET